MSGTTPTTPPNPTSSQLPPVIIEGDVVPPAVRDIGRKADDTQRQYIASLTGQPPVPPADATPPQPTPTTPETVATPPTVTPPGDPDELPPDAPAGSEAARWQHSYKSAKGRFDAQRQRDQETINSLMQRLQQARTPPPQPTPPPTPTPIPDTAIDFVELLGQEVVDTWGADLLSAMEKVAAAKAAKAASHVQQQIAPQVEQIGQSLGEQAEQRMVQLLDQALRGDGYQGNFDTLNSDQRFIQWLQLTPPGGGAMQEMLIRAWNARNGSQVLSICRAFLREGTQQQPAPNGAAPSTPPVAPPNGGGQPPRQPHIPLESLAAPGRAPSGGPSAPGTPDKPIYTRAEVKQFYDAKLKGLYAGREAEAAGHEQEIFAAEREGRIV